VDSCTAIVEHLDGRMELVEWGVTSEPQAMPAPAPAPPAVPDVALPELRPPPRVREPA
jgi:hypothetical protein